jgi:hypothetical protein
VKIAVVTAYDSAYRDEGPLTDANKQAYCDKHGYDFHSFTDSRLFSLLALRGRHAAWGKLLAINRVWQDYDWVFWTDADSIIMNPQIRLESFIGDFDSNKVLGMPRTWEDRVTTGNFFAKYSPASVELFEKVWLMDDWAAVCDWEESALNVLLEKEPKRLEIIHKLNPRDCNSFLTTNPWTDYKIPSQACQYSGGDFMLHLLRLGPQRLKAIQTVLDCLQNTGNIDNLIAKAGSPVGTSPDERA